MEGSMAYFELVNARGGIHGRKIQVVLKDDHYEPDTAALNTNELITKDRVFVLFDYMGTATLLRILPLLKYYEAEQIVNVAPFTGASPQRSPPYDRFVFNIRASFREETRALVRYLYARGLRRIGFLGQADAYGKSGETGVNEALAEYGLKPVGIVGYGRNQTFERDMRPSVHFLREKGADAVIAVGLYGPCGAFIRDARLAGWDLPIASVSSVDAAVMLDTLREESHRRGTDLTVNLVNSQVVPLPDDTRYPLVANFLARTPGSTHSFTALEGWLNAVVLVEGLRRAGPDPTRAAFIRAMESLHGWDPGLGVKLGFSPSSHQAMYKVWLTRTRDQRWVSVPPAEENQ
jgi:branched-chain amino acid transport system substrate-binding protein